jgi:hypothetical protein
MTYLILGIFIFNILLYLTVFLMSLNNTHNSNKKVTSQKISKTLILLNKLS